MCRLSAFAWEVEDPDPRCGGRFRPMCTEMRWKLYRPRKVPHMELRFLPEPVSETGAPSMKPGAPWCKLLTRFSPTRKAVQFWTTRTSPIAESIPHFDRFQTA